MCFEILANLFLYSTQLHPYNFILRCDVLMRYYTDEACTIRLTITMLAFAVLLIKMAEIKPSLTFNH